MQLTNQILNHEADDMLNYYKTYFSHVSVVYCNKCETPIAILCKGPITGDMLGLVMNDAGYAVVPVGDGLLSSRARLDMAPNGEPMLGFQCGVPVTNPEYAPALEQFKLAAAKDEKKWNADQKKYKAKDKNYEILDYPGYNLAFTTPEIVPCGNNTLLADVEVGLVPVGAGPANYANPFEKHSIAQKIKNDPKHKPDYSEYGHIRRYETFRSEKV